MVKRVSTITLEQIRSLYPCASGWRTLLYGLSTRRGFSSLPHDKPFPAWWVYEINGFDDFRWLVFEGSFAERPWITPETRRRFRAIEAAGDWCGNAPYPDEEARAERMRVICMGEIAA